MKRKLLWGFGLLGLGFFIIAGWGFLTLQGRESLPVSVGKEDLIRLHVLANSDNTEDQQLKLKVRDAVIAYLAPYLEAANNKEAAKKVVVAHKQELITISEEVLSKNGAQYPVDIEIGMFDFPIKAYGNLVLPAGKYEAVRILIGKAEGKNWWCVLFPPLCFIDITNATAIPKQQGYADNQEQQDGKIEFRFKLVELWKENVK
ncbi:stage II sporulation protein R [Pelosinus sp. UFO1]|uniref:stage II sporulation protein R n=1 Tax=Pelosinus sp. UFO1 TaxID=484770 RepID=UPI0004D1F3A5|nr:stage II sporulation protein R [Pelosinus sp. UFO1]AIF51977.1 stage II sporulation protein R [Pelosinus sp. UFO1]